MECVEITEVKKFMSHLLMRNTFDDFLLSEAEIVTFNVFRIDGHVQKKYYSNTEYEELGSPQMSKWGEVRTFVFEIIKGNKTPVRFKIVLKLAEDKIKGLLSDADIGGTVNCSDIGGLYLNISYENNKLHCITGTAMNVFTMDKTLEHVWDKEVRRLMGCFEQL